MMKYVEKSDTGTHSVGYEYDNINNLTKLVETIGTVERKTSYTYDEDNRPTSVTANGGSRSYIYDDWGRVATFTTKHGDNTVTVQEYTYKSNADGTLTNQISAVTVKDGNGSQLYAYTYTYDQKGNITGISDGTYTTSYAYDSANQLIREEDPRADTITVWTYDSAGNILSRTVHPYTAGTVGTGTQTNYVYNDSQWGDLLKAYDRRPIVRDEIGNPTKDFAWNYTWRHGRQLASMTNNKTLDEWRFTYNADGLRTQRTNGATTYNYTYLGNQLTHMTVTGHTMYFAYDAAGVPMSLTYDGATYYYVTNLQGDVIAILDSTGTEVVRYAYDAWGNIFSTTGTMAATLGFYNPLRYRGYVYDEETELYYLQTRYYNPDMGRFINGDNFASTGQGFLGHNMYAYCGNNPVVNIDTCGTMYERTAGSGGGGGYAGGSSSDLGRLLPPIPTPNLNQIYAILISTIGVLGLSTGRLRQETVSTQSSNEYCVYALSDPNTQEIEYIGRTKDPVGRKIAHSNSPARGHLDFDILADNLNYLEARGMEQIMMQYCHTLKRGEAMHNQINGISPTNGMIDIYLESATSYLELLDNQVSNDILNFLGL